MLKKIKSNKIIYVLITALLILTVMVIYKYQSDVKLIETAFVEKRQEYLTDKSKDLANKLNYVYQSMRTISFLPGIRRIDRYGKNFTLESKITVQQIYNNAFTNINLSELYIIPKDFNPDKIDFSTHKLEEPILTFDEFIIQNNNKKINSTKKQTIEEVEIFEYREMKDHLEFFSKNFPAKSSFIGIDVPFKTSQPLITCDNSEFTEENLRSGDNQNRLGIVLSVPFYSIEDNIKGLISAVIRLNTLSKYFDDDEIVLVRDNKILIGNKNLSLDNLNSKNFLSEKVATLDSTEWKIYRHLDLTDFYQSSEYKNLKWFTAEVMVAILGLLIAAFFYLQNEKEKNKAEVESKAKSDFLAMMSHEIRTPLNGIIGLSQILLDSELEENQKSLLQNINNSGKTLLAILNDVLDYSKIISGKMDIELIPFDIAKLIKEVFTLFSVNAASKNISLKFEIDKNVPQYVIADSLRLRQILSNLISNSIKFTEKGEVKLDVRVLSTNDEFVKLKFDLTDSGIGIDENKLNLLFNQFQQLDQSTSRKYGGTGLGLSIVKKLVELMGGEILVSSKVGVGTTFTINLSLKIEKNFSNIHLRERNEEKKFEIISNLNVLLVEDNEVNILVAKKFLEKIKANVTLALNGEEAVNLVAKNKFDLVLMDCQMPVMDGYQATEKIRKELNDLSTVIIALTANSSEAEKKKCLDSGMNDFLTKPIKSNLLYAAIEKWASIK